MSGEALFEPRVHFGQGKSAATLLTEDGCHYPIIAHGSYTTRQQMHSAPFPRGRGTRPMHASTLMMTKPPWTTDYTTTSKQYFGGSKSLNPAQRPEQCQSMHMSQFYLGKLQRHESPRHTNYSQDYTSKDIMPASRLHLSALVTREKQTAGSDMKAVVKTTPDMSYWSQYNRVHSKLGCLLGPGVTRDYPVRKQYNFITGDMNGPAWKENNPRVSGNRVLHSARTKAAQSTSLIS